MSLLLAYIHRLPQIAEGRNDALASFMVNNVHFIGTVETKRAYEQTLLLAAPPAADSTSA